MAIIMFLCVFIQQIAIQLMYKMVKESKQDERNNTRSQI